MLDLIKQKGDCCAQKFHSPWKYFRFLLVRTGQRRTYRETRGKREWRRGPVLRINLGQVGV